MLSRKFFISFIVFLSSLSAISSSEDEDYFDPRLPPKDATLCPLSEYIDSTDSAEQTIREFFQCPGPEDPANLNHCCGDRCCEPPRHIDSVLGVDIKIAMVISLTVICACIALGVLVVVCCFVSSCPLYDSCSGDDGGWREDEGHRPSFSQFFGGLNQSTEKNPDRHPLTGGGRRRNRDGAESGSPSISNRDEINANTMKKENKNNLSPVEHHMMKEQEANIKITVDHV